MIHEEYELDILARLIEEQNGYIDGELSVISIYSTRNDCLVVEYSDAEWIYKTTLKQDSLSEYVSKLRKKTINNILR